MIVIGINMILIPINTFILENKEYWVEVIGSNLIFSKKEKDEAKLEIFGILFKDF